MESTGSEVSVEVKLLSAEDLQAFIARRGAVEQAKLTMNLLAEGYNTWAAGLTERYSIEGPFSVDPRTGQIQPIEPVASVAPVASETDG